jgi:O-Antigen ligase
VLTLGFAARGHVITRVVASCALVPLAPTLYFTFSRGAVVALGFGLAAVVVCDRRRLQLTVAAAAVLPLPIIAARLAGGYSALTTTATQVQAATHDGHRFGTVLIFLVALQIPIALAVALAQRAFRLPRRVVRGYGVFVAGVAVACAVAVVAHYGGPVSMWHSAYDSFRGPPVGVSSAGADLNRRFASLSSNGRLDLWREAWRDFERSPLVGSGAGSYEWWWAEHQPYSDKARDAHSLYAETLAEMGLVGLALIVAALAVPLIGLRRVRNQPLVPFAIGAYVAFVAHIGVDWDWEMPVVILSGLFCSVAILLVARRDDAAVPLSAPVRVGAIAVVAVGGVLAFAGLISSNALVASRSAEAGGRLDTAENDARKASTWAPWSAEPWKQLALVQRDLDDVRGARRSLRKAVELEPLDYSAWLDLGNVSTGAARRRAFAEARRLYPLNPLNPSPTGARG